MNTFTRHPEAEAWAHELLDHEGGQVRPFASKRLTQVAEGAVG